MVSSISSSSVGVGSSISTLSKNEQSLTVDQQALITQTLSQFDAESLTQESATSIIEAFAEAGIQPSATLESALTELGFDAKNIGDLANVSGESNRPPPPPPPPKQSAEEITSMVDFLSELLAEKFAANNSNELSDEDKQSILAQVFEKFDIDNGDSIINTTA